MVVTLDGRDKEGKEVGHAASTGTTTHPGILTLCNSVLSCISWSHWFASLKVMDTASKIQFWRTVAFS